MNRRRADAVVGFALSAVLLVGVALAWQADRQQRALDGMESMMGTSMGAVHGTNPLWYVLGAFLVAAVAGGLYLAVRDEFSTAGDESAHGPPGAADRDGDPPASDAPGRAPDPGERTRPRVLDVLPDDERRVLEPVLSSPGVTQIELRDRSEFSKSKVSQTVSALEKRGLLYRERQGRTYRVYPSDDLRLES